MFNIFFVVDVGDKRETCQLVRDVEC